MSLVLRTSQHTRRSHAKHLLKEAIGQFEKELSLEQQTQLQKYKLEAHASPPDINHVMRLTAQIDQEVSSKPGLRNRCFGPRFTNILQSIQQFASIGDVLVGGSQNLIACGVWSLVRFSLLLATSFSSCVERMSKLLMDVGRSAPRYQELALLYSQSENLQSSVCQYFLVTVRLCHQLVKFTKQTVMHQLWTFLTDQDIKGYQDDFQRWATSIKEDVNLAMNQSMKEQASGLQKFFKSNNTELERRKARERAKSRITVLDHLSTYDFQTTWKEIRKAGNTTLIHHLPQYSAWKSAKESSTLVCQGKLGSGKSVLLANIISDLNLNVADARLPVAYFFCRHDIHESLKARTVIGSLIRQLLDLIQDISVMEKLVSMATAWDLDGEDVRRILSQALPSDFRAYLVLDGLDECDKEDIKTICRQLRTLQNMFCLRICISHRLEADDSSEPHMEQLARRQKLVIPEDNPDITDFIHDELTRRLDSGELTLGNPALILEISQGLLQSAQGMFLYVVLQIESLCREPTDDAIRQALANLPNDLPETFSRILKKSAILGPEYQQQVLRLIIAALRPLTMEELREALSVVPGEDTWNPSKLVNNVKSALASCGSLVTVDEESLTVRLVHRSIAQFLLGEFKGSTGPVVSGEEAEKAMRDTVITYLSYGVFESQLTTKTQVPVGTTPSRIIQSMDTSKSIQKIAIKLLQSNRGQSHDIGRVLAAQLTPPAPTLFAFLAYAKTYWSHHSRHMEVKEGKMYALLKRVAERYIVSDGGQSLLIWAIRHDHEAIFQASLLSLDQPELTKLMLSVIDSKEDKKFVNRLFGNGPGLDWIIKAKEAGLLPRQISSENEANATIASLLKIRIRYTELKNTKRTLFRINADLKSKQKLILALLAPSKNDTSEGVKSGLFAILGYESIMRYTVDKLAEFMSKSTEEVTKDETVWKRGFINLYTPNDLVEIGRQICESGVDVKSLSKLLPYAAQSSDGDTLLPILLDSGVDIEAIDQDGNTALIIASQYGNYYQVWELLERGAKIEARNTYGKTPLLAAVEAGHIEIINLLIRSGADIETRDKEGNTPLLMAAWEGYLTAIDTLLEVGADKEARNHRGTTLMNVIDGRMDHKQRLQALDLLVGHGPASLLEQKDMMGETPLMKATMYGYEAVASRLLSWGAKINAATGRGGKTPLMFAAGWGHESVVQLLLDHSADIDARDDISGWSPLIWAVSGGHSKAVGLLLRHGANRNLEDRSSNTPEEYARGKGYDEIVKLLQEVW